MTETELIYDFEHLPIEKKIRIFNEEVCVATIEKRNDSYFYITDFDEKEIGYQQVNALIDEELFSTSDFLESLKERRNTK